MYSLAVFPRQVPIPTDWLDTKNITDAFHHCNCDCTPPSGSTRDPVMTTWFHGICPYRYPYGLYNSTQNILLADLEDPELLHCLQSESYLGLFSFLSDLEWYVYNEFNTFLKYPIVNPRIYKIYNSTNSQKSLVSPLGKINLKKYKFLKDITTVVRIHKIWYR